MTQQDTAINKNDNRVSFDFFRKLVRHAGVQDVVYSHDREENVFRIGFLPEGEFLYAIDGNPDVFFQGLDVEEVYHEPYRTFIRLKKPVSVEVSFPGTGDKLYVRSEGE